jgi:ubiquinone/menaquinone biosynthesis methyltransferase
MEKQQNTTDFGFKKVKIEEKSHLVKQVFDNVATSYDIMNDFMSGGMHRVWKDKMVKNIDFSDKSKIYKILDVAGGTGDIAFRILKKARENNIQTTIEVADINQEMLDVGKSRAVDNNLISGLQFTCANGEELPYENDRFDYYTIAFGIRNFTNIDKGLAEAYRVLKPGGKFICLEFSQVNNLILSKLYDLYSFNVIPKLGKLVARDEASYQYLVESIRKFPHQEKFKKMIQDAGFKNATYQNLSFGAVAIHSAYKN